MTDDAFVLENAFNSNLFSSADKGRKKKKGNVKLTAYPRRRRGEYPTRLELYHGPPSYLEKAPQIVEKVCRSANLGSQIPGRKVQMVAR